MKRKEQKKIKQPYHRQRPDLCCHVLHRWWATHPTLNTSAVFFWFICFGAQSKTHPQEDGVGDFTDKFCMHAYKYTHPEVITACHAACPVVSGCLCELISDVYEERSRLATVKNVRYFEVVSAELKCHSYCLTVCIAFECRLCCTRIDRLRVI